MTMYESGIDRLPPHNRDAERSLLGSILRDPFIVDEALAVVRPDDFYVDGHRRIFASMLTLAEKGSKQIDVVTVFEVLTKKGWVDDVGGVNYLASLFDAAPSTGNWRAYCESIQSMATRRSLIYAGQEMISRDHPGAEPAELVASAEKAISAIAERGIIGETVELQSALRESLVRLDARREHGGAISGVPTGFIELDSLLSGFQSSELIIIGARTSVGKTAFALNVVRHAALECKIPTLFVSLEQSRVELAERLLCMDGRVDSQKLRRGHLSVQDQTDLMDANDRLSDAPLMIADAPVQNMTQLAANARRWARKKKIAFIVVDYLQLIDPDDRRANRQEQVASSSRRLKFLARELKIPVIALAQVNRGPEDRADKRPKLSDLRESGAIEQDADAVIFLHRTEDSGPTAQIEVIVAKQRNGPIGDVKLIFHKAFTRFYSEAMQ